MPRSQSLPPTTSRDGGDGKVAGQGDNRGRNPTKNAKSTITLQDLDEEEKREWNPPKGSVLSYLCCCVSSADKLNSKGTDSFTC